MVFLMLCPDGSCEWFRDMDEVKSYAQNSNEEIEIFRIDRRRIVSMHGITVVDKPITIDDVTI